MENTRRHFLMSSGAGMAGALGLNLLNANTAGARARRNRPSGPKPHAGTKSAKITLVQLQLTAQKGPDSVIERMPAFFEKASEYESDLIAFPEYVLGSRITIEHSRVEMYGLLTQDVKMWQDYPEIPWDYPECETPVNRSQL